MKGGCEKRRLLRFEREWREKRDEREGRDKREKRDWRDGSGDIEYRVLSIEQKTLPRYSILVTCCSLRGTAFPAFLAFPALLAHRDDVI
jgi:hypothetical protein